MSQSVQILSIPHQLQGSKFNGYVKDPSYESLLEDLICGVDFVFEEASGRRPSVAEILTGKVLGSDHYSDVDPAPGKREQFGIAEKTGKDCLIDAGPDSYHVHSTAEHLKREKMWLQKILDQPFGKALVVCGSAHGLSFAFRLECKGFSVQLHEYLPYNKLCTHGSTQCEHM